MTENAWPQLKERGRRGPDAQRHSRMESDVRVRTSSLPADNNQRRQLKAMLSTMLSTMHLELVYGADELSWHFAKVATKTQLVHFGGVGKPVFSVGTAI